MEIAIQDLHYICEMIYKVHDIPVFYLNQFGEIEHEFSGRNLRDNPYYNQIKKQISVYTYDESPHDFPIFFSNSKLNFFFINLKNTNSFWGTIILGPTLVSEVTDEDVNKIFDSFKGKLHKRKLIEYYQSIPIIDSEHFLTISLLVYYLVYQKKLDQSMVIHNNKALALDIIETENPELELSKGRRNFIFHSNLSYEQILLDYVKNGRIDKLQDIFDYSIIGEAELGLLSKRNRLRSEKNLMITGIALVCRAAIEGGLNDETAFTLSDFYIQRIEELGTLKTILKLTEEAIKDFTNRVNQIKTEKYSPTITTCHHYIYDHLYEEITLDQLAEVCHLSPNYLSSLFKKEVGIPISEYMQRQRVEEAKKLLLLTNYSISDIGTWLNFHDQSYFIKTFKKYTSLTPRQFRNAHSDHQSSET